MSVMVERFADLSGGLLGAVTGANPMKPGGGVFGPNKDDEMSAFGVLGANPAGLISSAVGADTTKSLLTGPVLGSIF